MACVGAYMHEAYLKVLLVLVVKMPNESRVPISLGHQKIKREFIQLSYAIYVMQGTSEPLAALGIETATLSNLSVLKSDLPSVLDYVSSARSSSSSNCSNTPPARSTPVATRSTSHSSTILSARLCSCWLRSRYKSLQHISESYAKRSPAPRRLRRLARPTRLQEQEQPGHAPRLEESRSSN